MFCPDECESEGNCPNAYAYAYDESSNTALWTCDSSLNADYTLTFCPCVVPRIAVRLLSYASPHRSPNGTDPTATSSSVASAPPTTCTSHWYQRSVRAELTHPIVADSAASSGMQSSAPSSSSSAPELRGTVTNLAQPRVPALPRVVAAVLAATSLWLVL